MDSQPQRFVQDWLIVETLGEGAFGEVKLLVHEKTNESIAMKIINKPENEESKIAIYKEERLHRLLKHPNIIHLLGKREEENQMYLFLEYAQGGELFDRIEPDVGMHSSDAQRYMKQLLEGISYLHTKGIAHRDIKPENLLLDENQNLKISDFGMATIFRMKGRERLLDKRCGTLPYVAPEILKGPYRAEPADLWSCGIVLVAMLTGALPWNLPSDDDIDYQKWLENSSITDSPWNKLSTLAFSLIKKLLNPKPNLRLTLSQIKKHPWMNLEFTRKVDEVDSSDEPAAKRIAYSTDNANPNEELQAPLTQPLPRIGEIEGSSLSSLLAGNKEFLCFSQPVQNEDMFISTESTLTQYSQLSQGVFTKMVKRMTRFEVNTSYEKAVSWLCKTLDNLQYCWSSDPSGIVTVTLVDSCNMPLVVKVRILNKETSILLDFRLSKGCGIEFKRRFVKIKKDFLCALPVKVPTALKRIEEFLSIPLELLDLLFLTPTIEDLLWGLQRNQFNKSKKKLNKIILWCNRNPFSYRLHLGSCC